MTAHRDWSRCTRKLRQLPPSLSTHAEKKYGPIASTKLILLQLADLASRAPKEPAPSETASAARGAKDAEKGKADGPAPGLFKPVSLSIAGDPLVVHNEAPSEKGEVLGRLSQSLDQGK